MTGRGKWKVRLLVAEDTTLTDPLGFQLLKVEDEVQSLVDNAVKELCAEKFLAEISQTWAAMEFSYEEHHRNGAPSLKSDEQLLENLDSNQELEMEKVNEIIKSVLLLARIDQISGVLCVVMITFPIKASGVVIMQQSDSIAVSVCTAREIRSSLIICSIGVAYHLTKLFDNISDSKFHENIEESANTALGMYSREKKCISFSEGCGCSGQSLGCNPLRKPHRTVRPRIMEAILAYEEKQREPWGFDYPAQVAFTGSQIWWFSDVEMAFGRLEEGLASALKDCHKKQVTHLNALITVLLGELSWGDQWKIMTVCTIDVHTRDVVASLLAQKLRHRWDDAQEHCFANTCDAQFQYFSEYLEKYPLARYCTFDGQIFLCYLRYNRFLFLGEKVTSKSSAGIFITMNPGNAGQTEPHAILKFLLRLCAMAVSNIELISEIMLVAEGFIDARLLARKFITLSTVCGELLSKQDHYDWGLRAIKSVLVVAGSLKGDKNRREDQVLMALRDFILPKIVTDDIPVFTGLISDLFPALDVPRKRNLQFEQMVKQSTLELPLQPEESFILKVVQLEELLAAHALFVAGNAMPGKSKVLKVLHHVYVNTQKPIWNDLNPKAQTADELFGFIHHATQEWKDSLLSSLRREQAKITHRGNEWLTLDGDIDPMWIKSLNTVGDNMVLTLTSNEDVPMTPSMWLLFEVHHLRDATPGTVSRTSILYLNTQGLGWNQRVCVASWIETGRYQFEKANWTVLFDKYVPPYLGRFRARFKTVTPIPENSMVQNVEDQVLLQSQLTWCHFANSRADPWYMPVKRWEPLRNIPEEFLESYNEMHVSMNLVLFEGATQHVGWISCILEAPRGYPLLVGVGGSGKQSLLRLAAYICSLEVFQVAQKKDYRIQDLRVAPASSYIKTGAKNIPTAFLLTDAQVPDERFLVLINDLLASGEVPDLFSDEDVESIVTGSVMFLYNSFRRYSGKNSLIQATVYESLLYVGVNRSYHSSKTHISDFMAYPHTSVNMLSAKFNRNERRYNYTTLKSLLEKITFYKILLENKSKEMLGHTEHLVNGMQKLKAAALQVLQPGLDAPLRHLVTNTGSAAEQASEHLRGPAGALVGAVRLFFLLNSLWQQNSVSHKQGAVKWKQKALKSKLASQEAELQLRNQDAEALIARIGFQAEKVSQEGAIADAEEQKVSLIPPVRDLRQKECEDELLKSEPALVAATAALDTLNKVNLTELKAFTSPHVTVMNVIAAVMVLLAYKGKAPKDQRKAAKVFTGKVDDFLQALINYDKEHIPQNCLKVVKEHYSKDPDFNPNYVHTKPFAAAGLCAWVINIVKFNEVYCEVEPKRCELAKQLAAATEKLEAIRKKLLVLDSNLCELRASLEKAVAEKVRCQDDGSTNKTVELANRLGMGLESENTRWSQSVENLKAQKKTLCGDILLTAAFVSYFGPFTKYCQELMEHFWIPFLMSQKVSIPVTEDLDPIAMLTDDAVIVARTNEGLHGDRMSTENATILTNCECPLMIDPQLQGIKWIKNKYGADLKVIRLGQKGTPILDPLLGRHTVEKGKYIKTEDKECEFHKNFRLILHAKLANPHCKPELQARTTLINFTATRDGLEEQLLAEVVSAERPDLEKRKSALAKQQNCFTTELRGLEDDMLLSLSAAQGGFLDDSEFVEKLKSTKSTAAEILHKNTALWNHLSLQWSMRYYGKVGHGLFSTENSSSKVSSTPTIFVVNGVDEKCKKLGFTVDTGRFHNISLGRGQEMVAEEALEKAARCGHRVLFQNIYLVAKWLGTLEKLLEQYSEESHPDFHVFISAEPAPTPEHIVPRGILENSNKITSEPPTRTLANLRAALYSFDQDTLELCTREGEFKGILFPLCYFHSCAAGRPKFGPPGWNGRYRFSAGDLAVCIAVLCNYFRDPRKGRFHGKTCVTSWMRSCTAATSPTPGTAGSAVSICKNSSAHLWLRTFICT
ncbi:LOW QUALITY PROTEIN: dynein axonemal heavy chain 11 [Alca torda]